MLCLYAPSSTEHKRIVGFVLGNKSETFINGSILWLAIVLSSTAMFAWQCHEFIGHYLSRPVRWKISVSQQQPVVFSAVTICNQNAFRYDQVLQRKIRYVYVSFACDGGKLQWRDVISRESSSVNTILTTHILHHPITLDEIRLIRALCAKSHLQLLRAQ